MAKPRLLDLFCGAGGAAVGYARAGFDVVGVDIVPQPRYLFEFHQYDVMSWWRYGDLPKFDVYHASPPCQRYSAMSSCRPGLNGRYPDLIGPTRELLKATDKPYVIENVPGAPLLDPIELCGHSMGMELYRHRLFESNVLLVAPEHRPHTVPTSRAGHWTPGTYMSIAGHVAPIAEARRVMEIDWMTRDELTEAIPPAYTEYLGRQLLAVCRF